MEMLFEQRSTNTHFKAAKYVTMGQIEWILSRDQRDCMCVDQSWTEGGGILCYLNKIIIT